jgi:translation initiation factor IF-2
MLKARVDLQRNRNIEHQIRNTEVNNYYTHNNIIVKGDNSGSVQAGVNQTQNNNIGINNLSKSGNGHVGWLAKIIAKGLQIAKFCLRLKGLFRG